MTPDQDQDPENVDYLVCARAVGAPAFAGNFIAACWVCGVAVEYRWDAPHRPKKICMQCAIKQMEKEETC